MHSFLDIVPYVILFASGWSVRVFWQAWRAKKKPDGNLEILEHNTRMIHQLEIITPPEKLGKKKTIVLGVKKVKS